MLGTRLVAHIMQKDFEAKKGRNPSYSLRAYSKQIGISSGALCDLFNGNRPLTPQTAKKIVGRLSIPEEEKRQALRLIEVEMEEAAGEPSYRDYSVLEEDRFRLIAEWQHFAILSLTELKDFQSDPDWVAERLGISQELAEKSIQRLLDLELLSRTEEGELLPTHRRISSTDEIPSEALIAAHQRNLELAASSLNNDPLEERCFKSVTMAIDPKKLPMAKEMMSEFRDKLARFLETDDKQFVYLLNLQLFPLTKTPSKN